MPTAERILQLLEQVTETPEVRHNLDLPLYDRHLLDSLRTVELIVAFGQAFALEISPAAFEPADWATPRQVIAFVQQVAADEAR